MILPGEHLRTIPEAMLLITIERLAWRVQAADPKSAVYRATLTWLNAAMSELNRRDDAVAQAKKEATL